MKKQLLTMAVLCAVAFTSNAQTEKGNNLIGGNISYSTDTRTPESFNNATSMESNNFSVGPRFGHFFSKNFAVGISAGFNSSKYTYEQELFNGTTTTTLSSNINKNNSFYVGPFVRYYVDIVDKFKFYGQGNFNASFGKTTNQNSGPNFLTQNSKYKSTQYSAVINPGFAFFPTKRWAFEFSFPLISYNKYKLKDDGNNLNSQAYQEEGFQFGLNSFNPSIGVNFHF